MSTWVTPDGTRLKLIHEDEFHTIPNGHVLFCIDGKRVVKGTDYIDLDTRGGYLAYGRIVVGDPTPPLSGPSLKKPWNAATAPGAHWPPVQSMEQALADLDSCDRCGHDRVAHVGRVAECEHRGCRCEEFCDVDWQLRAESLANEVTRLQEQIFRTETNYEELKRQSTADKERLQELERRMHAGALGPGLKEREREARMEKMWEPIDKRRDELIQKNQKGLK
jgi:hypothetical protein